MPPVDAALRRIDVAAAPAARDPAIADVDVFDDIAAAAPVWDRLADGAVASPFARRDWIELWQRHVGALGGARPLIAVARDARGEPLLLLPLARRTRGVLTIAHYFGGRHSQLNMGLWRPDVAASITGADLTRAFATIAERSGVDLFLLLNQPATWGGRPNPLVQLAHQPSPDNVFSVDFGGARGDEAVKSRLSPALRGILKGRKSSPGSRAIAISAPPPPRTRSGCSPPSWCRRPRISRRRGCATRSRRRASPISCAPPASRRSRPAHRRSSCTRSRATARCSP